MGISKTTWCWNLVGLVLRAVMIRFHIAELVDLVDSTVSWFTARGCVRAVIVYKYPTSDYEVKSTPVKAEHVGCLTLHARIKYPRDLQRSTHVDPGAPPIDPSFT